MRIPLYYWVEPASNCTGEDMPDMCGWYWDERSHSPYSVGPYDLVESHGPYVSEAVAREASRRWYAGRTCEF